MKKNEKSKRSLRIDSVTLRPLISTQLEGVAGASTVPSCTGYCSDNGNCTRTKKDI